MTDVKIEYIPEELKESTCWVGWNMESGAKVPKNPIRGGNAKPNDKSTFGNFDQAVTAVQKYGWSGIGLVFTGDNPYIGIDLDHCIDKASGEITDWAKAVMSQVETYWERSPSSSGLHAICKDTKGVLPRINRNNREVGIEIYTDGHYLTVTGDIIEGGSNQVGDCGESVLELYNQYFKQPEKFEPVKNADQGVIQKLLKHEKYRRLWQGDWETYYDSSSEADLALCSILAFYTGRDVKRVDSLFRQSKLYRDKWERKEYRENTIYRACSDGYDSYILEDKPWYFRNGKVLRFQPAILARYLQENVKAVYVMDSFYKYHDGVYRSISDEEASAIVKSYMIDECCSIAGIRDAKE